MTTKELRTKFARAYEEWREEAGDIDNPNNINPRIVAFVRKVILGCRLNDTKYLIEIAKEYTDIWESVGIYEDLVNYLENTPWQYC